MIVSQNDDLARVAFHDALGVTLAPPFVGLVVSDDAGLAGALAFNGFDKINVDMSVLVLKPWSVSVSRDIAKYVFCRLKVRRVTCLTSTANHKAINRLIRLGFECEGVLKERLPQGDAFLFGLLASRQKFLRLKAIEPAAST